MTSISIYPLNFGPLANSVSFESLYRIQSWKDSLLATTMSSLARVTSVRNSTLAHLFNILQATHGKTQSLESTGVAHATPLVSSELELLDDLVSAPMANAPRSYVRIALSGNRQRLLPTSPFALSARSYHTTAHRALSFGRQERLFDSLGSLQSRRSLFNWLTKREANAAEELADRYPLDVNRQVEAYRLLLKVDPVRVVERYESKAFASNQECTLYYLSALQDMDRLDRILPFLSNRKNPNQSEDGFANANATPASPARRAPSGSKGHKAASTSFSLPSIFRKVSVGSKDRPLHVKTLNNDSASKKLMSILWNVALIGGVIYFLFNSNNQKFAGISLKVHQFFKKDAENVVTFHDVQGCDEAKNELQEIVAFLKNPEKFSQLGAKLPKGVLLVGPPGTGKTLLAKAVAGEAGVPFIYASGSEFDELFVGIGSLRIRQMFESAKEQAPSIIFIDEIDAIGSKRNPRDPQHARMSLNQLLVELDGFAETKGVIVIAATNFPESLDKALLRPGRFDRHIHVPLPDIRGRTQILKLYMESVPKAEDVDIGVLARSTPGFSGADLSKLVNSAKILASIANTKHINMENLERAKDEMILGTERKSAVIPASDRRLTAYHEGGHAIVALHTPFALPIHKATIMPRGNSLGMVAQLPDGDQLSLSKVQLLAKLDVCMGGRAAEELIFGSDHVTTGASSDFNSATMIARSMVTKYGMSDKIGPVMMNDEDYERLSPQTRALVDAEIKWILEESQKRAKSLLMKYAPQLHILANSLLERETMTRGEIEAVLKGDPLPPLLNLFSSNS